MLPSLHYQSQTTSLRSTAPEELLGWLRPHIEGLVQTLSRVTAPQDVPTLPAQHWLPSIKQKNGETRTQVCSFLLHSQALCTPETFIPYMWKGRSWMTCLWEGKTGFAQICLCVLQWEADRVIKQLAICRCGYRQSHRFWRTLQTRCHFHAIQHIYASWVFPL